MVEIDDDGTEWFGYTFNSNNGDPLVVTENFLGNIQYAEWANIGPLTQLRERDPLALALTDQIAFELCKGSHHTQQHMRHGRIFTRKGQAFFPQRERELPAR